jgi:hypothetical protein
VIGQLAVFLLVSLELLFLSTLQPTIHLFGVALIGKITTLNNKEVLIMLDILRVNGVGGTLAKRKIVHCIQQIGLPHPVLSDETIHLGREIQLHLLQILIIQDRNPL